MKKLKRKIGGALILAIAMGFIFAGGVGSAHAASKSKKLIMNINREGTAGFACGTQLADVVTKNSLLTVTGVAYSSPVAGLRDTAKQKCDIPYCSTTDLMQIYNNEGPYKASPIPMEERPFQGFYYLDATLFFMTKADRDDIKSLSDLNGKKVFPGKAGSGISEGFKYILNALDIKVGRNVQMGYMDVASALKTGMIDAAGGYGVIGGKLLPGWMKNIDKQLKIKAIDPSPEEIKLLNKKLAGKGLIFQKLKVASKNLPVKIYVARQSWGWHFGAHVSEEDAYQFMKACFTKKGQAKFKAGHKLLAKFLDKNEFMEQQNVGISSIVNIPVHPGVAKYYKEIGVWRDSWTTVKTH